MTTHDTEAPLRLEGDLTIYQAAELKRRLMEFVARAEAPGLDLAEVTDMDTAGLQLLLLARRAAAADAKPLQLLGASPAVMEVLALCNLDSWLDAASASDP